MARPQLIEDDRLIAALGCVFRNVGYAGASLAMLSEATGLKKASLYHRFPDGKEQMAREVLSAALGWFEKNILSALRGEGAPAERLARAGERLSAFYGDGSQACLLNMLASPRNEAGPFSDAIKAAFEALIDGFACLAKDAGIAPAEAERRAERAVILLQGSLVVARGLAATDPFRRALADLPRELLSLDASASHDSRPAKRSSDASVPRERE